MYSTSRRGARPAASRDCAAPARAGTATPRPPDLLSDRVFLRLAPSASLKRAIACLESEPRAPSASSTYFPCSAMPRVKPAFGLPSRPIPMSPVAIRRLRRWRRKGVRPRRAGIDLDPERLGAAAHPARHRAERPMSLPWLLISFGIMKLGSRTPPEGPSNRKRSVATSVFSGRSDRCASRAAAVEPIGSKTMRRGCARRPPSPSRPRPPTFRRRALSRIAAARRPPRRRRRRRRIPSLRRAGSSSSPAMYLCLSVLARGQPAPPRKRDPNCAVRRRLSIPPSSTAAGNARSGDPSRARFTMGSSNRSTSLTRPPPRDSALVDRGRRRSRARRNPHDRFAESAAPASPQRRRAPFPARRADHD